ncbi:MAG: hypothetical protein KBA81_02105 [Rhabdochlamydiaceae bacterium]|nr:hypothetical protein [Rhabdochlamydiaceae bacterium]
MFTVRLKMPELSRAVDRLDLVLRNNSTYAITEFSTQMRFLIANTLNECRDIADQSIDKIDSRLKNNIEYIQAAVLALEESVGDKVAEFNTHLTYTLQTVLNPSPFLSSIEPSCIIRTSDVGNAVFTLKGHFTGIGTPGPKPSLVLNGVRTTLINPLLAECSFSIPRSILFSGNTDACVADVEIPFQNLLGRPRVHKYRLLIGIIPPSPGTIVVEHIENVAKREINPTPRSGHFHYASSHARGQRQDTNNLCRIQASPGWKVLHGSHQVQIHHNKGATTLQLEIENDAEVAYRAGTYYRKSKKECGELRFTFSFSEYREHNPDPVKTPVELQWNESKLFDYPPGTWKVIFTPFDSKFEREFLSPHIDDPFININSEEQGLRISTKDPAKIKRLRVTAALPDNFTQEEEESESYLKKMLIPAVTHTAAFAVGFGVKHVIAKL